MKLNSSAKVRDCRALGFTLVEMLIASTTLVMVFGAVVAVNLWGLAMTQRSEIWLLSTDDTRKSFRMLHNDIRTAYTMFVGAGSLSGFTPVSTTNIQAGNALLIYASTNTNSWCMYYFSSTNGTLYRTNWDGVSVGSYDVVSANPVTNDNYIFTMEDYLGRALSNATPYPMISVYLSYTKLQNPQIVIEPGSPVDFYQINTKISPRMRP